jgi:hypothetical protein
MYPKAPKKMRGDMQIKYSRRIKDSGAGYGDAQNLTLKRGKRDFSGIRVL